MRKFLIFMLVAALIFTMAMSGCTSDNSNVGDKDPSSAEKNSDNSATKPGEAINSVLDSMTGNDKNTNNNSGNSSSNNSGSTSGNNTGNTSSSNGTGNTSNNNMSGNNGASDSGSSSTDNSSGSSENVTSKGIFMFNSKVYNVTDERIETDKVGEQLMAISYGVTSTPAKDGEALGLDNGTRVYKIKDSQDTKEVAVELNGKFFRASQSGTNA